jgi:hypothetical protein
MRKDNPANEWGWTETILADIAYRVRWLQWSKTWDGQHNVNHPKPIERPRVKLKTDVAIAAPEYLRRLKQPWREVRNVRR